MSIEKHIVFKTAMPEIDVIVTNCIGGVCLTSQYAVAEIDTDGNECPQWYGLMPYDMALERAKKSVEEIRILASATIPEDTAF